MHVIKETVSKIRQEISKVITGQEIVIDEMLVGIFMNKRF